MQVVISTERRRFLGNALKADPNCPDWYANYIIAGEAGTGAAAMNQFIAT
jgi:hypothetical protein